MAKFFRDSARLDDDINRRESHYLMLVYTTPVNSESHDFIGSSISGYQVLFTSWQFPEKKMMCEPHFVVKYSSYLGTAIKLVLYILKQLFASVSVNSGGYLPR